MPSSPAPFRFITRPAASRLQFALLFAWAAALAWLSLAPRVPLPPGPLGWDKLDHALAYLVLTVLLLLALRSAKGGLSRRTLVIGGAASFSYGLILEVLQSLMALGRQGEVTDLAANALGTLAACVVFCRIKRSS